MKKELKMKDLMEELSKAADKDNNSFKEWLKDNSQEIFDYYEKYNEVLSHEFMCQKERDTFEDNKELDRVENGGMEDD